MPKTNTCNISHFQLAKYYSYFTIFMSNSTLISQVLFNCNKLNRDNYLPDNPLNLRSSLFQLELIISTLQSSSVINWLSPFIVFKMSISHWFLSKKRGMNISPGVSGYWWWDHDFNPAVKEWRYDECFIQWSISVRVPIHRALTPSVNCHHVINWWVLITFQKSIIHVHVYTVMFMMSINKMCHYLMCIYRYITIH